MNARNDLVGGALCTYNVVKTEGLSVEVETAHDARVGANGMVNVALGSGSLNFDLLSGAFSLGGDLADFLLDDAFDDTLLHLPAAVVTSASTRTGTGGWSRRVAGRGRGTVGSVRASGVGIAIAIARAGAASTVATRAAFRVVDDWWTREDVCGGRIVDARVEDSWVGIGVATGE